MISIQDRNELYGEHRTAICSSCGGKGRTYQIIIGREGWTGVSIDLCFDCLYDLWTETTDALGMSGIGNDE